MDADNYQRLAARTLIDEPDTTFTNDELAIMLAALELGTRAGAVCDYVKKSICHRHGFKMHELGNLLVDVSIATNDLMQIDITHTPEHQLSGNEQMLIWCALGLGGEAGEVMDTVMAMADPSAHDGLVKELGDEMWYGAALCTLIGVPMSDVMQANIDKLTARYKNGYSSEDSKNRIDTL